MKEVGVLNRGSAVERQIRTKLSKVSMGKVVRSVLLACAALIISSSPAMAQAGRLDATFGVGGVFTDTAGVLGTAVAVQSNGKIVVGGEVGFEAAVLRLNANGALDSTFGSGGAASITFPGDLFDGARVVGLAIQSDGKIVAGISNFNQGFGPLFLLARLNVNGSLDNTFGSGGVVETQIGPVGGSFGGVASVLALQPDGKILLAGQNAEPEGASGVIARYDANGQLDNTFGSGGIVATPVAAPTAIALQPDGKILLASGGTVVAFDATNPGVSLNQVAGTVSRYNSNGSLDTSFGISGQVASVAAAGAIVVEKDGVCSSTCKIVVAGTVTTSLNINNGNGFGFGVIRYNTDGIVDRTFGQAGAASTSFTPSEPEATPFALAIQSNGDILAAGTAGQPGNPVFVTQADFALARYTAGGVADTTFGSSGEVTTAFGTNLAAIYAVALQSDGKIVAVGGSLQNLQNPGGKAGGIVVARYLGQ
jgi:uncharacterized delta-60 repeat protein